MRFAAPALLLHTLLAATALAERAPLQSHVLPNGLTVLVAEDHALPLVTVEIGVKTGSMTEPPELSGLSHLFEHMFFKANAIIPGQGAYLRRMRALGMAFNGTTETERVNYFFTTTSDHLADSLAFMRDAITTPLFRPDELEKERRVVTGELDRNEASPGYHYYVAVTRALFSHTYSRKLPIGNRETILGLPTKDVLKDDPALPVAEVKRAVATVRRKMQLIQGRWYVPNNSVLVVTGDVTAADVFAQVDTLFAAWKRTSDPFQRFPLVRHPPLRRSEVVVVAQPVTTVSGSFNWLGPSVGGPETEDSYPADLLGIAVSRPGSRFQRALVDSGACIRAGLGWHTQRNVGPASLSFEATPEQVDTCVRAALAELPKLADPAYITADELADAAYSAEVRQAAERETTPAYAHTLTAAWAVTGLEYRRTYVERLRAVGHADLARYLNRYLLDKPFVFAVLLSPELVHMQRLDTGHFEALLGLAADAHQHPSPAKEVTR